MARPAVIFLPEVDGVEGHVDRPPRGLVALHVGACAHGLVMVATEQPPVDCLRDERGPSEHVGMALYCGVRERKASDEQHPDHAVIVPAKRKKSSSCVSVIESIG